MDVDGSETQGAREKVDVSSFGNRRTPLLGEAVRLALYLEVEQWCQQKLHHFGPKRKVVQLSLETSVLYMYSSLSPALT